MAILGLFFSLDQATVEDIRDRAVELILAGKTTMRWRSAGQEIDKEFAMSPKDMLAEANAALAKLAGTRVRHTYANFR